MASLLLHLFLCFLLLLFSVTATTPLLFVISHIVLFLCRSSPPCSVCLSLPLRGNLLYVFACVCTEKMGGEACYFYLNSFCLFPVVCVYSLHCMCVLSHAHKSSLASRAWWRALWRVQAGEWKLFYRGGVSVHNVRSPQWLWARGTVEWGITVVANQGLKLMRMGWNTPCLPWTGTNKDRWLHRLTLPHIFC